jgi:hypothetical protein
MVIGYTILTISSGPTTFNERDGGDRFRRVGPQCCNTIINRLLRNQVECGTSEGGGVGLEICGRSLNHDTKIPNIPHKNKFVYMEHLSYLCTTLLSQMWGIRITCP